MAIKEIIALDDSELARLSNLFLSEDYLIFKKVMRTLKEGRIKELIAVEPGVTRPSTDELLFHIGRLKAGIMLCETVEAFEVAVPQLIEDRKEDLERQIKKSIVE